MTRRIPAPPPADPSDRRPRESVDVPPRDDDDELFDEGNWADDPADDPLFDPTAWSDEPDDDLLPEGDRTDSDPGELDGLGPLGDIGHDGIEDDVELPPDDRPLEDDLTDLDAPDDADVPVLPWALTITVDGKPLPATVDPVRERSVWVRPGVGAQPAGVRVTLAVAGVRLAVDVAVLDGQPESVVLGRDVLAGRFLLRP